MTNNTLLANVPVDLMYQALETEKGGVQIYTTALRLAINKDLREEWNKYLEQTKNHVQVLSDILTASAWTQMLKRRVAKSFAISVLPS